VKRPRTHKFTPRATHIITGLTDGGAEAVLYRLCQQKPDHCHTVISLGDDGKYGPLMRELGITVVSLNMPRGRMRLGALIQLWRLLRKSRPDVIQTWMYHADLVGGVVARLAGIKNIVWGVHHTTLERGKSKRSTIWVARICAVLSHFIPRKIICCAQSASHVHRALGYDGDKLTVVNNGYNLTEFRPNQNSGLVVRAELEIPFEALLVGMVGRFDPQKDHENLLTALAEVRSRGYDFYCLLVGKGLDNGNESLIRLIKGNGLTDRVQMIGPRSDIAAVMNALNVHVLSSSHGEAFPNVLAEAMACGTPCVATDVGDSRVIIGDTGWIVPAKDAAALASGLLLALSALDDQKDWRQRQLNSRKRIQDRFSVDAMMAKYEDVWTSVS
jgi:glycosyltransferase involved in cell wall biosynthesis